MGWWGFAALAPAVALAVAGVVAPVVGRRRRVVVVAQFVAVVVSGATGV